MSVKGMQIVDVETDTSQQELTAHGNFAYPLAVYKNTMSQNVLGYVIWHWHDEYQFSYVTEGEINFYVNSESFLLKKGQGIFINSGCMHSMKPVSDPNSTYVCINIDRKLFSGFKGSLIEQKYLNALNHSAIFLDSREHWHRECIEKFMHIYQLYVDKYFGYEIDICTKIMQALSILVKNSLQANDFPQPDPKDEYQKIKKVLSFIHKNYAEKITLEEISAHIFLSKNECCRLFKRKTHMTIFEYILEHRINKSIELLLHSNYSISQIAVETGFSTVSYYIEVFRKHIGETPNEYKKRRKMNKPAEILPIHKVRSFF